MSTYTNAFAFTQLCGVLCAPWNGLILDRHKRGKNPRPEGNRLHTLPGPPGPRGASVLPTSPPVPAAGLVAGCCVHTWGRVPSVPSVPSVP